MHSDAYTMRNMLANAPITILLSFSTGNETGPMEECNRMALISQENNLKLNVKLNMGLLDQLQMAAGGFLNEREVQAVQSKGNNAEQMGEVIHILLGKRNANFMIFCAKLRKSNNAVWADVLEGIGKLNSM